MIEPRGDDDGGARPLLAQFPHDIGHSLGRGHDHGQIGNPRQIGDPAVAAVADHLRMFGIDRPDLPLEAAADDVVEDNAADRANALGRADDNDGFR